MRKQAILLLLILCSTLVSFSQLASIKGSVKDTVEKKNPSNAVVSLLRQQDSVLVKFKRTDKDGNFSIPDLQPGKFILMITHPYMGDYFDTLDLPSGAQVDLAKIYMTPKTKLLAEVILKSGSPIRIKGDTTVYTADSFKVRPGANVEELLRRLPGIQVDRNGQITAMGERVKKVLVDGEEFFGSDPGIATKNLRADVVKEVEVFDKKSDQAEFTGIDDGVKDKTINLKLKDDKKKGYFGKVEAGGGLKDKYDNSIMLNAFKGKRKLAGYGIMSNTGQTNLDWKESQNYGGGMDNMSTGVTDDGGMWISMNSDDGNFYGGRNGIPQNWNGGLHFNNKFNNNKQSFNAGYKFSRINAPGVTRIFSQTFLPDSSWSNNSTSNNYNSTIKHAFNMTVDLTLDSANSLKWTTRANNTNTQTRVGFYGETLDENNRFINNSTRNSNNKSDNNSVNSTLLWRHKFKKLARTLSLNTDLNWNRSESMGLLNSLNNYFIDGALTRRDTTDQQNERNSENRGITSKLSYTEPLRKDFFLELSYSFAYNGNKNERVTSIKDINDKYINVVDSLSNAFEFNRLVHTPGFNFRLNKKKYNLSFGASVGLNRFTQTNITEDTRQSYNFSNFFPQASYTYKFKPNESWRINYNGSSNAPTLEQLQPIRVNTDPLNIYIGNQDLKQSFRHSVNTGYNSYNVLKERGIWTNLSLNFTDNAFVQSNQIDSIGRRVYQTVNASGLYSINFFGDYNFKIKDTKWRIGIGPNLFINRNVDFVNGIKIPTKNKSYGARVNIGQYVDKKYRFDVGPNFTWRSSSASVNTAANAKYWQLDGWASAGLTLPKSVELNTDANLEIRQKDPRFPANNNFAKWNASVIKRFAKDVFEVKFGVYGILNQNRGYDRNFNSYSFTESFYTTLKRFWLLTLTWNISKNGKPVSDF